MRAIHASSAVMLQLQCSANSDILSEHQQSHHPKDDCMEVAAECSQAERCHQWGLANVSVCSVHDKEYASFLLGFLGFGFCLTCKLPSQHFA